MSSKIQYNSLDIIKILKCSKNTSILLDEIIQKDENEYYGIKYITLNEKIYNGHFPEYPMMPGVMQLELTLQAILVILQKKINISFNINKEIFLKKITDVKFKKPIIPGNILISKMIISKIGSIYDDIIVNITNYNENNEICSCAKMFMSIRNKHTIQNNKLLDLIIDKQITENKIKKYDNIKKYIPHRFPFLLIDYIEEYIHNKENNVITTKSVKNITNNDPMVYSYFSDNLSVLSGPLQCEMIAQTGCICQSLINQSNKLAVFATINNAEFYYPITIGNTLKIEAKIIYKNKNYGKVYGAITINDKLISKHEIIFIFIDKKTRRYIINE